LTASAIRFWPLWSFLSSTLGPAAGVIAKVPSSTQSPPPWSWLTVTTVVPPSWVTR
jgi:hypothetical protein